MKEMNTVLSGEEWLVTESGFDRIPVSRRGKAYRGNDAGWTGQLENLRKYLA